MDENRYRSFRVWLRSKPSFETHYDGYVDVFADDDDGAREAAFRKLQRGAFPERPRDAWIVVKVESK